MEEGFVKNSVQRFGKFLSAMVMPNIGALIAFGFLAALFIDTGWIPNKGFNSLVSPLLTYLIPILISSTGGRMIGGDRGRVVGAIAVIGAIMSNHEQYRDHDAHGCYGYGTAGGIMCQEV